MPHEFNNQIVVTKDELVPDWYNWHNLKNTIRNYMDKEIGIKRVRLGGNGRQMLILFDSLPQHIQDGLGDPRKCKSSLERFYRTDGEAVTFYSIYSFNDGTCLDIEYQEKYIINASVLKAVAYLRAAYIKERGSKGIVGLLCADTAAFNKTLKIKHGITHTLPAGEKSFKQALKDFETDSYESLISNKHKNGNSRKVTDETLSLLNSMFATDRTKPTATEVHRRYNDFIAGNLDVINNISGEIYEPETFKRLSNSTVKKYMAAWVNQIGTHAKRSGDRQKYMGKFKTYHSLERPKYAGSIISIDDRQPAFKTTDGKRVWFYNGLDIGSDAFTCWVYGTSKDGIIIDFYRQLVRNYAAWGFNLPYELEAELSLNSSHVNTFLREGAMFQRVRLEANNARGKYIERRNKNLRYEHEKELEGWLPRPFAKLESNQEGPGEVPALPYSEIIEGCLRAIENYNNQPHPVHSHLSKWQVFQQMQNPDLKPTNYLSILPHIGYKTKTSCRVGIIHLNNGEYLLGDNGKVCLGQKLISLMKQVEGEQIDVWWLDDDAGRIFKALVFIGTQYICEAVAKPTYNRARIEQGPEDNAAREIMSAYVATIGAFAKDQKRAIEPVTLIDNRPERKKTFVMPGLKQYGTDTDDRQPVEILPDLGLDDYDNIQPESFVRPLIDRF